MLSQDYTVCSNVQPYSLVVVLRTLRFFKVYSLPLLPRSQSLTDWNDRRLHRVFLCFYSAVFKLTSAKFQIHAYNSRTVWSSYMKSWQQFEVNELHVCTKFRGNRSRDLDFRTRKPSGKFGIKSGLIQKQTSTAKDILHAYMFSDILSSLPTNFWPL